MTQTTTVGSRNDNSGFITQRTLNQRSIIDESSPANLIKIRNEQQTQKYQSDSENENNLSYLSKTNAKIEKKRKINYPYKNKINKIQKLNSKNQIFNKQFLLEESPFSKYFSKQIEDEDREKKNDAESDGFSEGGSDSESEGEDYDKAFLKNFQVTVQRDFQLFDKFFRNLENFEVKTEQTNEKRNQSDIVKGKDEYLNEKINFQLTQKKYDLVSNGFNKINEIIPIRQSFNNQTTITPQHLRTPIIRPKTNERNSKIEYILGAANSSRNTPQKQHTVKNSVAWDIFKDRNQIKKRQSKSQLKDSNLLSTQMNFQSWSDQKAAGQINFDRYDDLYNQEFTQIDQALQGNYYNRTGRHNSATPFKDDNLNIINFLHRMHNTPLVQTTNNQSLMKIINKIKEVEKRGADDQDDAQGKRVLVLTNNTMFQNNVNNNILPLGGGRSHPLVGNSPLIDTSTINNKNKILNHTSFQGPSSVHLKNILNTQLYNNLSQLKDRTQTIIPPLNFYQQNGSNPGSQVTSPKRQFTNSYQQFLQQQSAKIEEYSINQQPLQNSQQDPYYVSSNGFGIRDNKDDSIQLIIGNKKRDSTLQNQSNTNSNYYNNNSNNSNNYQMQTTFNNKFHSANNSPIQQITPIKNSYNKTNFNFARRISQQPYHPIVNNNDNSYTGIINPKSATKYSNISPRESSNKKMNCPSAFYKIKKHFCTKKKTTDDTQKQYSGYNPSFQKQQQQSLL